MSFTLRIAAATDKSVRGHDVPDPVVAPEAAVATILTGGVMHVGDAARLAETWVQLFAEGADTVVIEMHETSFADGDVREDFVQSVIAERRATHHLYAHAMDLATYDGLASAEDASAWLMATPKPDNDSPRRTIIARSPLAAPPQPSAPPAL